MSSRGLFNTGSSLSIDTQRLLAEARIERAKEREERAETLSARIDDFNARSVAMREEYERARAEAEAQAQAQAAAFEEQQRALAEAATVPYGAELLVAPEGEDFVPSFDGAAPEGSYSAELEAMLEGVTVPEELQLRVDNMQRALASADALMAQGMADQARAMREALQQSLDELRAQLGAARQEVESTQSQTSSSVTFDQPVEEAPPADEPAVALETLTTRSAALSVAEQTFDDVAVEPVPAETTATTDVTPVTTASATGEAAPVDASAAASPSPLDAAPLADPQTYFEGSFDTPPPGGWFFGVGDSGQTGQGSVYQWLPEIVGTLAAESEHGHYLLAGSDEVTTVDAHLAEVAVYAVQVEQMVQEEFYYGTRLVDVMMSRDEAIAALRAQGQSDAQIAAGLADRERFVLQPEYHYYGDAESHTAAVYGTRAQYLEAIGLPVDVPGNLQIAFNRSGAGGGDAWLEPSHGSFDINATGPQRAYVAIVDDRLAGEWVQIGDIGPLNDDIEKMLGGIFEAYGAKTPAQQEALRSALFKYDERFGVMARTEFIEAAVEQNNNRRQGFFERGVGRTLLTVAASFIPGAGPYVAMALNAGFALSDGASFGQALKGAAISYFAQSYGAQFGEWVGTTFGEGLSPAMASVLEGAASRLGAAAITQLATEGRLDGDGLLTAAVAGGFGSYITSFVDGSDFGRAIDEQFGRGRAGDIMGRLASASVDGRISPEDFLNAFAAGRADASPNREVQRIDGQDGTHVVVQLDDGTIAYNPDGSITQVNLGPNGELIASVYDAQGNLIAMTDMANGMLVDPAMVRTANIADATQMAFGFGDLTTGLGDILGLPAGSLTLDPTFAGFDGALGLVGDLFAGAAPDELHRLEEGNFGFDGLMCSAIPQGTIPDAAPADLTQQTYTRDENGLETWRDPETGKIVYQRAPDGATLAVTGDRRVVTDANGHVVSVQGGKFGDAFAQARESGTAVFEWNGRRFTTVTREDLLRQSGGDVDAYRRYVAQTGDVSLEGYAARITDNKWAALANGGVDASYWRGQGFTPEQVATFYAVNGNDHRLAQLQNNPGGAATSGVTSQSLAETVASNLGKLPAGVQELYNTMVRAGTNFLESQTVGGQPMSAWEAFGAVANFIVDRGVGAAQRLVQNTNGAGEAALVVTGAVLHTAWDATGGALQRAYTTMTDPNATPQQVAVAAFEFVGAAASVVGATAVVRSATAATTTTTQGLGQAANAASRTVLDAAGAILPDNMNISRFDFVGSRPSAFSANVDLVQARINGFDVAGYERHIINVFDDARHAADLQFGPHRSYGSADGAAGYYDIYLNNRIVSYDLSAGELPTTTRFGVDYSVLPRDLVPGDDVIEIIQHSTSSAGVVRHEYQHVLDYAEAANDITSPNLLRVVNGDPGSSGYGTFAYTELNGFRITGEELSQAYSYAMATGNLQQAAAVLRTYERATEIYGALVDRSAAMLESALSPAGWERVTQSIRNTGLPARNADFEVYGFTVVAPDGTPLTMQAEVPRGLSEDLLDRVVRAQLEQGLARVASYRQFGAEMRADLGAIQSYHTQVTTPVDTGGGGD